MAKYDVAGTVTISTTVEPNGYLEEPYGGEIEDFQVEGGGYSHDIEK